MHRASLLINLDSRQGKKAYTEVMRSCQARGIEITATHKMGKGVDLYSLVRSIKRTQPELLIVAAGDGTVSRVVGYMEESSIEIGIIPLGTTNNFARSLGIPFVIEEAVALLTQCSAQKVDLGQVGQRNFANVVGIGISALVASNVTGAQKHRWGRLAYAFVGLKCLLQHKPFFVTVTDKDGELELHFETHQVIIANGRYHAGQAISADARVDNHELIVFPIGGRGRINFIIQTVKFYIGPRKSARHASYLIARDIKIHTSTPQPSEVDGEHFDPTPLSFCVKGGAVQIRYKKRGFT